MGLELGLGESYYLAIILFQVSLTVLMLARDPEDRYPDAASLLTDLSTGRLPASIVLAEDQQAHADT